MTKTLGAYGTIAVQCKCGLVAAQKAPDDPEHFVSNDALFSVVNNKLVAIPKEEKKVSFMTSNHKEAGGAFDPIEPGYYEALITQVEVTVSKKGADMIKAVITIRNDVDQAFQKRKLFDYWVASEAAMFKFQQVAKACGYPDGHEFPTLEGFAQDMLFQPVRISVKNRDEEYNGETKTRDYIAFYDVAQTPYNGSGAGADPFASSGAGVPLDINDDDLPF